MKRPALGVLTALLPASVLVAGMAHADVAAIAPMPYVPDSSTVVGMAQGVLADTGVPVDLSALPMADIDAAVATVEGVLAGAVPSDLPVDPAPVVATVQDAVAGAGLPLAVPTDGPGVPALPAVPGLPAVPALPAVPDVGGVVSTVTSAVAGLPLPLDVPALPAAADLAGVLGLAEDTIAGLGISLPGS
jgi:hypothetical protein